MKDNLEDIYTLSSVQQGILFHTLFSPETGVYIEQLVCSLRGELNIPAFERAWQEVMQRHTILRTAFIWEDINKAHQLVHKRAKLPIEEQDWRGLPASEQERQFNDYLEADRRRGFDLSRAPLMRFALFRETENSYRLLWTYHHLLLDGWSLPSVLREAFAFYDSFRKKQSLQIERSRPYRDYIAWLKRQDFSDAESYWRQLLKGFTAPTTFGLPRVSTASSSEAAYSDYFTCISEKRTARLQRIAREHKLTLNTFAQGAWAMLLSRYSGEEDVVFGVTVSGRSIPLPGIESMVGLFINTLPMRASVSLDAPVLTWLQSLQDQQVETSQYEYSSLVQVKGWSNVVGDLPLFNSILVFENYPKDAELLEGRESLEVYDIKFFEASSYPITVAVAPGKKLSIKISYDKNEFESAAIERMAGHYATLLEAIADDCHRPVSDLPMLTPQEEQSFASWNQTSAPLPQLNVHQIISLQAQARPLSNAVSCGEASLCYQELNQRANQLAHYLQSRAIAAEQVVAVCLDRSIEQVVALLGVMKAGGAYLPIDPSYPPDRIRFMLDDSSAAFVITQQRLLDRLAPFTDMKRVDLLCIDSDWQQVARFTNDEIRTASKPKQLAYLIYTSGTTGQPKAVEVEHHSLTNTIAACQMEFGFCEQDRWVSLASSAFDIWLFEVVNPLVSGAEVEIVEQDEVRDVELLVDKISRASVVHGVPSLMRQVVSHHNRSKRGGDESRLAGVRKVFVGGDEVSRELIEGMREVFRGADMRVLYGPTEAAIICASHEVGEEARGAMVGRAMKNVEIKICDRGGRRVPVGVEGEIYIGGEGVSRGYRGRAELTEQKYVEEGGRRYYRSGDRGRYKEEGEIEYRGRGDEQVKVRGHRVEIGEVESAMMRQEGVRASAVVVEEEEVGGEKRLIGYVEMEEGREVEGREIRERLREELPDYEVPVEVVVVERMPMTAHGKVDKKELRREKRRVERGGGEGEGKERGRTAVEEVVAGIWAEVLGVERVGINESFFDLGGHSLKALELVAKLRSTFQVDLPMRSLFDAATVAGISKELIAIESKPGQLEKIAQLVKRIQDMSAGEVQHALHSRR